MQILKLLLFSNSRKVGFGLWLFITATVLLCNKFVGANEWMICAALSATLVGGGTVLDGYLNIKKAEK